MKTFALLALSIFSLNATAASSSRLDFENGAVTALATWLQEPRTGVQTSFKLEWTDAGQAPLDPGAFKVKLWMPDMHHGSSPVKIDAATDAQGRTIPGSYVVSKVFFSMGGHWEIDVTRGGETQVISIDLGGEHHH